MAEPIVRLEGITKDFGTKVVTRVLHGIDLAVAPGEFTALMGPSGSGKSTLLNILGLLDRPTGGRIVIAGQDTSGMPDETRTRFRGETLGFVFQFHYLLPAFTALENVMLPSMAREGRPTAVMRKTAADILDAVELSDQAYKLTSEMSGGQQQRVAIARALAMSPRIVLADEPTGNLDTATGDQVLELLSRRCREAGAALLMATHAPLAAQRADRVLRMADGALAPADTAP
jgi:lipoprotein-releasing system ATP-binding protein